VSVEGIAGQPLRSMKDKAVTRAVTRTERCMPTDPDEGLPEPVLKLFDGALRIGYMSTVRPDGSPFVVPVGIMIHEGKLRISSRTATRKIDNLERDGRISVCVTDPENLDYYVAIRGTVELAEDTDRVFIDWLARTHMGRDEYPYEPRDVPRTVITIRPERYVIRNRTGEQAGRTWTI
jgi:PPOX class probable F420-dependent enzyme